jgi:predicted aldo/keto reductase-like oxidoreductase
VQPEDVDRATGKVGPGTTSKAFLNKLDISLKRLKMDYVDILYVHALSDRAGVLNPELIAAVEQAKKEGKAKHIGVSTHRNEPEVIRACIESKIFEVVLASINYKQAHYAEVKKAVSEAAKAGIGIVAMKTMAGGFQDRERKIPVNCSAALKFVLQDENVSTSIPGITNFDQLKANAAINRDLAMTDKEKADLALTDAKVGGLYCQGCLTCVPDCPKGLPIPDLMRAYMYTYGYGDLSQARTLINDLGMRDNPCRNCSECKVNCAKSFNVSERIADVVRVSAIPEEFLV